jgi:hypothetical protein
MRKLIFAVIAAMVAVLGAKMTLAEVIQPFEIALPVTCGDTEKTLEGLNKVYNEEIVFLADGSNELGDELYHSLWINYANKTWSFIVVNKPRNITCVIGSGENFSMFFPGDKV